MKTNIHIWSYLAQFLLKWWMFSDKCCRENQNTHFMFKNIFFSKIMPFMRKRGNVDYILITNLMHQLLFIHKIIFSSTCFEPQVLIFRKIHLYTCSIWYCHSLWEFLVVCRYTLKLFTDRPPRTLIESDSTIYCMCTTVSSWRWALEARNM